jgi:hypothetical protein
MGGGAGGGRYDFYLTQKPIDLIDFGLMRKERTYEVSNIFFNFKENGFSVFWPCRSSAAAC